ncbi:MAG: caspase family protein [Pseudomonadota bacterium]
MNSRALFCLVLLCGALLGAHARAAEPVQDEEVVLQAGKMGLNVATLTPRQALDAGNPSLKGVRITEVVAAGPADKLGLRVGDIIVQANGKPVASDAEISALLHERLVGAATRLRVLRGAEQRDVLVPAALQPMLRIDAGMHSAPIRRLALDDKGRWLVTVSDDKTAKVWDLASARLLRTLRPPIGNGNEGKLAAVAMSPDGASVAIAGWTGMWQRGASVYLFDRATGRLTRQIGALPGRVAALAWSRDGSYLACAFAEPGGLQVYRTDTWSVVGADADYAGPVGSLDFDARNRLLSASQDGSLRLYGLGADGLRRLAKASAPGGAQPESARFSPSGEQVAVGFADTTKVSVLRGADLVFAYAPLTPAASAGDLRSVAWSADGSTLYAAGRYVSGTRQVIRAWPDAGRGLPRDSAAAANSIFDLRGVPGGGVAFATAEPAWGMLGANGQPRSNAPSPIPDYRGAGAQLQVSRDGHRVRFSFARGERLAADFEVENGLVDSATDAPPGTVAPPLTEFAGLTVSNWRNAGAPQLNGQPLRLAQGENARSLAIAPDGGSVVIGGDRGWSKFDAAGKLLGRVAAPAAVWAVNFSSDGRYLVAAIGDGTIRWFNARTGQEKLALFAHSDRQRWVAWTPSGYYSASAGGEELMGWHINNGASQAGDFYPASRFRARYSRPDVVSRVLEALSEIDALRMANLSAGKQSQHVEIAQSLPPVIDPVSPVEASVSNRSVTIRFKVRTVADAPLRNVLVRVNGGSVPDVPTVPGTLPDERSISLQLPEQDSTVELFAENRNGVSTPAAFKFTWKGAVRQEVKLPSLHVLAIGVSSYRDNSISLGFPAKDAKDFVDTFKLQQGKMYREVQVVMLTNELASRQAVLDGLARMKARVREGDVAIIFLAGHGVNAKDGTFYYVPYDFDRKKLELPEIDKTGVSYTAIRQTLAEMPGRAMLFIDTCHSGNVMGKNDLSGAINDLTAPENSIVVFASSKAKELSQEDVSWNNGAFTKALVEGLRGGGDLFNDGRIMYTGLQAYLSRSVTKLTGNTQHPVVLPGAIEDFVVALK